MRAHVLWSVLAVWLAAGIGEAAAATPVNPFDPHATAEQAAAEFLSRKLEPARYLSARCDEQPVTDWPGYEGRKVLRCQYSFTSERVTLSALVYLLNPSAANLATRIGKACASVGLADRGGCGRLLATYIVGQNGGQFPVAGFVVERKSDAGGTTGSRLPVYLEFRDGNTIVSGDRLNFTDRQLSIQAMEHAARAPVLETRSIARIANATRDDYRLAGGTRAVGSAPGGDPRHVWLEVIRENELRAQDTGEDPLLNGVAARMRPVLEKAF
jgi:hypothetical protein